MSEPADHPLLDLLAIRLAPLFLSVAGGDRTKAEAIARDTIAGLNPASIADLLNAGQAISFGLAAVTAIIQSAAPDLPEKDASRLRGQADRLGRSAERCRKALPQHRPAPPPKLPQPHPPQSKPPQAKPPQPKPPQPQHPEANPFPSMLPVPDQGTPVSVAWAAAMEAVAGELAEESGPAAAQRAAALRAVAQKLAQPPRHALSSRTSV